MSVYAEPLSLMALAVGLSMDVFSVSAVAGLCLGSVEWRQVSRLSLSFGAFHVFMPILGWLAGETIVGLISGLDHWVAFGLLLFVGGKMLVGGLRGGDPESVRDILGIRSLLVFSLAVSLDSVAVGLGFGIEKVAVLLPALVIGMTAFAFTWAGIYLGYRSGAWFGKYAEVAGGLVLIGIGIRVLISHMA